LPRPLGRVEKVPYDFKSKERGFVGTALVAVRLKVRTGIHPEGFILKDKPYPYTVSVLRNDFFNTPFRSWDEEKNPRLIGWG